MKLINLLFIGLFFATSLSAQVYEEEVRVDLSNPSQTGLLKIHIHNGKIDVIGHNENYVLVKFKNYYKQDDRDKSKGTLKKIPNAAMNVDIVEYDNTVEVDGSNDPTDYQIYVPKNFDLNVSSHHNSEISITGITGEMEVQAHHGGIEFSDVGGSVSADTHHGSITASFNSIDNSKPMAFSTYHGDIEVTFPGNLSCNTKLKSDKGDIYTDFELEVAPMKASNNLNEDGKREIKAGGWIYGSIGSGGKEYMFTTYHGDIILRKQ